MGWIICYFVADGRPGDFDTKHHDCDKTHAGATLAVIHTQGAQDFLKANRYLWTAHG